MKLKIGKKLRTASNIKKFTDSYKKRVGMLYTYHFIADNSDTRILIYLHILSLCQQRTNQLLKCKTGKFCLFMMYKLNVK